MSSGNNQEPKSNSDEEEQTSQERDESATSESKTISPDKDKVELEQLKKECGDYKDKYLRSIAEAENLRKRLHKERHDMTQMAVQSIIVDFLNPFDHLENALAFTGNMSDEVKNWGGRL